MTKKKEKTEKSKGTPPREIRRKIVSPVCAQNIQSHPQPLAEMAKHFTKCSAPDQPNVKIYRWHCTRCSSSHPCVFTSLHSIRPKITCQKTKLRKAFWRAVPLHDQAKLAKFMDRQVLVSRDTVHMLRENTKEMINTLLLLQSEAKGVQAGTWEEIKAEIIKFGGTLDTLIVPLHDRAVELKFIIDNIYLKEKENGPKPKSKPKKKPKKFSIRGLRFDTKEQAETFIPDE